MEVENVQNNLLFKKIDLIILYLILLNMIIPVKCFTCGEVLADKYRYYQEEVRKIKAEKDMEVDKVIYLTEDNIQKTPEGEVLDKLKLNKYCCRRHMLTHVDLD